MSVTMDRLPVRENNRTKTLNTVQMNVNTKTPRSNQIEKLNSDIKRGDIYMCDITGNGVIGSVQGGVRPCLVTSNRQGNRCSNIVIVIPISSSMTKAKLPTHVDLLPENTGLIRPSVLLAEQLITIDQWCVMNKVGQVDTETMKKVDKAIIASVLTD